MRDNRIYRPEQLTEKEKDQFFSGLEKYLDKKHAKEAAEAAELEAKRKEEVESGKRIVLNGHQFMSDSLSVKSIMSAYGLNIKQISDRFGIPYRTVQNWAQPEGRENTRPCPTYIVKMMVEILEK